VTARQVQLLLLLLVIASMVGKATGKGHYVGFFDGH
jgi:hypothetical protein